VFNVDTGYPHGFARDSNEGVEILAYLAKHPEALIDEPKPPEPTAEQKASSIRSQRNSLISQCDWTVLADAPLSTSAKASWKTYRQALRDITLQDTFPNSVIWPIAP
jgi:hypothetical protein